jgi:hypothetical protein
MLLGGLITWLVKSRIEELRAVEEKLRETRRDVYTEILAPFIRLFADSSPNSQVQVAQKVTSHEYRKQAFNLSLFGSDDVVRAYNGFMAHGYAAEATGKQDPQEMLRLWGRLLLEIRKSLGNKRTELDEMDMMRGMIKGIDEI